jgi:hypothetical protein
MQSLATTELLSFHPLLLETGVCVGIDPLQIGTCFPRQQLPFLLITYSILTPVVYDLVLYHRDCPKQNSRELSGNSWYWILTCIEILYARRFSIESPTQYYRPLGLPSNASSEVISEI